MPRTYHDAPREEEEEEQQSSFMEQKRREERRGFRELAERNDMTPRELGLVVAGSVPAEDQYEFQFEKFKQDAADKLGYDIVNEALGTKEGTALLFQNWTQKRKFDKFRTEVPNVQGPETIMQQLNLGELQIEATNWIFNATFQVFGNDWTAAALQTALIQDDAQREATWAVFEQLANKPVTTPVYAGAGMARGLGASAAIDQVLADPDSFYDLSPGEQSAVILNMKNIVGQRDELESIAPGGKDLTDIVSKGEDIFMQKQGWELVLDDPTVDRLKAFIPSLATNADYSLKNTSFWNTDVDVTAQVGDLGITHYRDIGDVPTFTFDEEWAKQNFEKHIGILRLLQELHPTANFIYGHEDGVIANLTSLIGRGVDHVSAIPGTLGKRIHEEVEWAGSSDQERKFFSDKYIEIRDKIASGEISKADMPEAMSLLYEAKDRSEYEADWGDLKQSITGYAHTPQIGTAFGDATVNMLGRYPGDWGYEATHALGTLIGQLVFDPTLIAGKVFKGVRLARLMPKGTTISRSTVTQALFDYMAMPPDVLMTTNRGRKLSNGLRDLILTHDTPEAFAVSVAKNLPIDEDTALFLGRAAFKGEDELHAAILQTWVGGVGKHTDQALATKKITDATDLIRVVDEVMPSRITAARRKLGTLRGQYTKRVKTGGKEELVGVTQVADATGEPVRVYHGTPAVFDELRPGEGPGLYGDGIYFTENPAVASGYAQTQMPVSQVQKFSSLEEADEFINDQLARGLANPDEMYSGPILDEAMQPTGEYTVLYRPWATPNVRFSYLDIRNPFRADAPLDAAIAGQVREKLAALGSDLADQFDAALNRLARNSSVDPDWVPGSPFPENLTNDDIYSVLEDVFMEAQIGDSVAASVKVNAILKELGFDGITHIGGAIMGTEPHRVWIAFDAKQVAGGTLESVDILNPQLLRQGDEVRELEMQLKELQASKLDAIQQKVYWESVMHDADFVPIIPIRKLPSNRTMRKLGIGRTKFGKVWDDATALGKQMPVDLVGNISVEDMGRLLRKNPIIDKLATRFMASARRWGHDIGAGQKLYFLADDVPEGMLADTIHQSYKHIRDFGRWIGAKESVVDEVLEDLLKVSQNKSRSETYKAFTQGYQRMLDSSDVLSEVGWKQFSDMWPELSGERAPGMVKAGRGANVNSTPTLSVPVIDEVTGDVSFPGVPVLEGDMLHTFTLPTFEMVRDHLSMTRSYLRTLQEGKGLGSKAAGVYFGASHAWRTFNAAWARAVLLGRMPAALPLRIQLEQAVRVEAFGYSSAVRHPIEWFKSVKGWDQFKLFAESPAYALGVIIKDYIDDSFGRVTRGARVPVNLTMEPEKAVRAIAGRMKVYTSSPSTRVFADNTLTAAQKLQKLQDTPLIWNMFKPHWDDIIAKNVANGGKLTSYEKIAARITKEIDQVIGTGPAAERVRAAIKSGRIDLTDEAGEALLPGPKGGAAKAPVLDSRTFDRRTGKVVTEDANEIADELLKMYESKQWRPDVYEFPQSWGDYLPPSKDSIRGALKNFSDKAFQTFYSRPDLYFGRSPLFRQMAAREFTRLRKIGYGPTRAKDAAEVYAARQVADVLFTIGANTSADYWIRSVMPFFPAWKELATTWLAKIPAEVGGGGVPGWMVGAPMVATRINAYVNFFQNMDILYKEGDQWRIKFPIMAPMVRGLTGLDIDSVSFSADSITSLLPTPSLDEDDPPWKGLMPTVGAPSGQVLHALNSRFGGVFEVMENNLTLFGGNQSLGPAGLDYFLEGALGWTPFWTMGSEEAHKLRQNSAFIDAIRLTYEEHYDSRPKREDFKTEKEYVSADAVWLENVLSEAERSSKNWYMLRGISSAFLPFSIKYDDDTVAETTAIWEVINEVEKSTGEMGITTPLLEGLKTAYPELELYLTGKTESLVPDNPERVDSYETYLDEIEHGKRLTFTPEQWLVWALGNQEAALHRSKMNTIFNTLSDTPQQWLLSGYESSQALLEETNRWKKYRAQSVLLAEVMDVKDAAGNPTSFDLMYDQYYDAQQKRYGDNDQVSLTLQQDQATKALDALNSLANMFGATQYTDDSYADVRRELYDVLEDPTYTGKDPVFEAVAWWRDQTQAYFDEKNRIWEQINQLPSGERGPYYRQLTALENEWSNKVIKHPKWGVMPDVQLVLFNKLSPDAQALRRYEWARLPVNYLSEFQREQVYGDNPKDKKINQLVQIMGQNSEEMDRYVDRTALSTSSTEYDKLKAFYERKNQQAAQELGIAKVYKEWQKPAYLRVDTLVEDNAYWDYIVGQVQSGAQALERAEISPRGSTPYAVEYQRRIIRQIEDFRKEDKEFDDIMDVLERAYGESADEPAIGVDMYWPLFFEGFSEFVPGYLNYR